MVKGEALLFLAGHFFSDKNFYRASDSLRHNDDGSNVLINSVLFLQEALLF